jgi:hypothetical protein
MAEESHSLIAARKQGDETPALVLPPSLAFVLSRCPSPLSGAVHIQGRSSLPQWLSHMPIIPEQTHPEGALHVS